MNTDTILYLSRRDVESVDLPMIDIIDALESMFREKGEGRTEMPPKPGIHPSGDAFIHAMPGYIPGLRAAGVKWVSTFPENLRNGLPNISGLVILNDPDNGIPMAVMDATWITAKRTGAATAVAAKYLAREESSSVGIVACGVQGRSNLEALSCVFAVEKVKAYDVRPEAAASFAKQMAEVVQVDIEIVDNPREAVVGQDLVVTSGPIRKDPTPAIEAGWLAAGSFASPVDYDSYWKGEALREADKFATDDITQMEYYRGAGLFRNTPKAYADLGEIVAGKKPGRQNPDERTISMNLGLSLDDMATAILIYQKAMELGIGRQLPL